jgi:hypothetical protein
VNQPAASATVTVPNVAVIATSNPARVRAPIRRRNVLILLNACSIGVKSGAYAGKWRGDDRDGAAAARGPVVRHCLRERLTLARRTAKPVAAWGSVIPACSTAWLMRDRRSPPPALHFPNQL